MKKQLIIYGLLVVMGGSYSCKGKKDNKNSEATTTETTTPTTTAPVVVNEDDELRRGVTDATKDFPGVNASVENGVITLTGTMERSRFPTLKQSLDALRPKQVVNNINFK
jgi:hypothetical protein